MLPPEVTAAVNGRGRKPLVGSVLSKATGRAWVRYDVTPFIFLVEHWTIAGRSGSNIVACERMGDLGYQTIDDEARFRATQAGGSVTTWNRPGGDLVWDASF